MPDLSLNPDIGTQRAPRVSPYPDASLYLDFLTMSANFMDSRITFSRGTNATLVDSTGRITYAPANLLVRSQEFDNAAWQKNNATITADATTSPDGTVDADKLVETTGTGHHSIRQNVVAGTYVVTVFAKAAERSVLQISGANTTQDFANFNLSNGTLGTNGTGATGISITACGNGWYRCSVILYTNANGPYFSIQQSASASWLASYTGDGTSGIFIWGAQLEPVTYQTTPSTYVATTSAAYYGPRFDYDPVTLAARGLLIEEQRTNLVTYSEQFDNAAWTKSAGTSVSANAAIAPDGNTTADQWIKGSGTTGAADLYRNMGSMSLNTPHSLSFYLKANGIAAVRIVGGGSYSPNGSSRFNLVLGTVAAGTGVIQAAGNGWYRCTIFLTRTGTSDDVVYLAPCNADGTFPTGDGTSGIYIWGAQLEAGSFATSYIPTAASTVTRNADVATMTGTNFSSWYNQSEGTFVYNATALVKNSSAGPWQVNVTAGANANSMYSAFADTRQLRVYDGSAVEQAAIASSAVTVLQYAKVASTYKLNDFAVSANGGTVATDTSGTLAAPTQMMIGSNNGSFNGWIAQIAYFNTRQPNAKLQTLTAPALVPSLSLDFINNVYNVGF